MRIVELAAPPSTSSIAHSAAAPNGKLAGALRFPGPSIVEGSAEGTQSGPAPLADGSAPVALLGVVPL